MTNTQLSFIKRSDYASVSAAQSAATGGKIVFDEAHKVICVNGVVYGGGNISDATYENNILKIWKDGDAAANPSIELNFNDIASASSMMDVFKEIEAIIGTPVTGSGAQKAPDYTGAHYISTQKNLIQADKTLDAAIWTVQGKAEAAQGYAETVQGNLQTTESRLQGYIHGVQGNLEAVETSLKGDISNLNTYAQGVQGYTKDVEDYAKAVQGYTHSVQTRLEQADTALQGYIQQNASDIAGLDERLDTAEEDIETAQGAINTLQSAVNTLETTVNDHTDDSTGGFKHWAEHIGVQGVAYKGTSLGDDALEVMQGLANAMQGIVDQGKNYTMVKNATAEEGYFATYQMQEVVGETITNVGVPINIPKDFLVKSAEIKTVTTQGQPYPEAEVDDKYIDFTINAKAAQTAGEETHLYLPVNELVDAYTVSDTATIDLEMSNNNITATLKDGSVQGVHIANLAVGTAHLQGSAVTSEKIADSAVTTGKIADGAVNTVQMADGAVTTAKLDADAVTGEKIADDAIGSEHINDNAVQSAHIYNGAVTSAKIANGAVNTVQMADGAVTSAKIADNAVNTVQMADGAVTTDKLGADAVTSAKIADNAVNSEHIAANAVQTASLQAGSVTSGKIANGAVDSQHLAANAVQSAALQDGSVTAAKLANDVVTLGTQAVTVNGDSVTLATVAGKAIAVQSALYWDEWA